METISAAKKRACLEPLPAKRLREVVNAVGAAPASMKAKADLVAALADGRKVDFRTVLAALKVPELRQVCDVLELTGAGRTKDALIDHILGGDRGEAGQEEDADEFSTELDSTPPLSARSSGALKSALRAFVLDVAGGYRGRDGGAKFTRRLFRCFGWDGGQPPEADVPATLSVVDHGERGERQVAAFWKQRRVLIEITQHDVMLDFAWRELLRTCLQLDPVPQYAVLSNQRDLHLYDLARDREAPRLSIAVDDLPKYSEAFPFLSAEWVPGTLPRIINVAKVSKQVADLVAKLYRSLKAQYPDREREVIKFTLQCIITMFAEDIRLLPQEHFTSLLYDGARHGDTDTRVAELFRLMSTPAVPGRIVPYFNGGLFNQPVTLHLGAPQLTALTKAAEANWTYVDPHIFGSVFQGIMDDDARHAQGAHYTEHDDIMRVVGPTIVEPWRERIRAAKSLAELLACRADLLKYRVLDPACGSGNFLYVSFRELYRLDTELLARMREFPSTQGQSKGRLSWGVGIQTSNFFGIDINPFAVELAKVTLNIAKKIAYEERREVAAEFAGQSEMDLDPSLPLDNLDENIVCKDALFSSWPEADAIVGNPPFLGGTKIREELGTEYVARLRKTFPEVHGKADFCAFWFRRAHDRLASGARAGLVGTQSVRLAKTREASLDYVVSNGGTITSAVSARPWPGDAVVTVSMVNWVKGPGGRACRLEVDGEVYEQSRIEPHLQLHTDVGSARELAVNRTGSIQGVQLGTKKFEIAPGLAAKMIRDSRAAPYVQPMATADDLLGGKAESGPTRIVNLTSCVTEVQARATGSAYQYVQQHVLPLVEKKARVATTGHYKKWLETWWRPRTPRSQFFSQIWGMKRLIVCSAHAARSIFIFLSTRFVPSHSLQVFAFADDYSFGILQSSHHWRWAKANGSKIKGDVRYLTPVWVTFPWPQGVGDSEVDAVARAGREIRRVRTALMAQNGWSLRALYQASTIPGAHPLRDAQAALDEAVSRAYGIPAGQEVMDFLLELNQCVAEDEADGRTVVGPGLPPGFAPDDPRWSSADCIEPPESVGGSDG